MKLPGGFLASLAVAATLTVTARAGGLGQPTGSGQDTISGYAVSGVHFELSAQKPTEITGVLFSLAPEPGPGAQVYAEIGGIQYPCVLASSQAMCRASGVEAPLASAESLTVVAAP